MKPVGIVREPRAREVYKIRKEGVEGRKEGKPLLSKSHYTRREIRHRACFSGPFPGRDVGGRKGGGKGNRKTRNASGRERKRENGACVMPVRIISSHTHGRKAVLKKLDRAGYTGVGEISW